MVFKQKKDRNTVWHRFLGISPYMVYGIYGIGYMVYHIWYIVHGI